jgi:hypothetical protein
MSQTSENWTVPSRRESGGREPAVGTAPSSLADILDRILDKGIVIVGDIQVNLLDIELLTIKIRLLVASVDRAREMGIDWWEHDPSLSSKARDDRDALDENERLRRQIAELERERDEERRGEELEEEPESEEYEEEYEDEELGEEPEEELAEEEPEEEPEEEET